MITIIFEMNHVLTDEQHLEAVTKNSGGDIEEIFMDESRRQIHVNGNPGSELLCFTEDISSTPERDPGMIFIKPYLRGAIESIRTF